MRPPPRPRDPLPQPDPAEVERLAVMLPRRMWLRAQEAALWSELDFRCTAAGATGVPQRARARLLTCVTTWLAQRCRTSLGLPASELPLAVLVHELAWLETSQSISPSATRAAEHADLAASWAGAWGLSGSLIEALADHHAAEHASEPVGGAALIALAEEITTAVCTHDLDRAERALVPELVAGLGLRPIDVAGVIGMAASELAAQVA